MASLLIEESKKQAKVLQKAVEKVPSRLGRLAKLHVYSYLDADDFVYKIRMLSKAERQLTENSAIARENKTMALIDFEYAGKRLDQTLKFFGNFESLYLDFDEEFVSRDEESEGLLKVLQNLPKRLYDQKIEIRLSLESYAKRELASS